MTLLANNIKSALSDGLLSFPVTDMGPEGAFDPHSYANRIEWLLTYPISALFIAGGTGEFFSLSAQEYKQIVQIATEKVRSLDKTHIPVISSIGRSTPQAIEFAKIAAEAGIDGLLLMPPYLVGSPQQGLYEYAKAILTHTELPVIYYNRSNGILQAAYIQKLASECPNLIGVKDGTGDMQELNDLIRTVGDRLVYIGGVPTAEIIAEAYLSIGVNTYSSAVFNFVPEFALYFYRCLREGKSDQVNEMMKAFYLPFVRLRGRQNGYAVSLIKAGANLIGRQAGKVRAPLVMPTSEEEHELKRLIERANELSIAP